MLGCNTFRENICMMNFRCSAENEIQLFFPEAGTNDIAWHLKSGKFRLRIGHQELCFLAGALCLCAEEVRQKGFSPTFGDDQSFFAIPLTEAWVYIKEKRKWRGYSQGAVVNGQQNVLDKLHQLVMSELLQSKKNFYGLEIQ